MPETGLEATTAPQDIHATVVSVEEESIVDGFPQIRFTAKDAQGKTYEVDTRESYTEGLRYRIKPGTNVLLQVLEGAEGEDRAFLADIDRTSSLVWLTLLFAGLVISVGYWRGLSALLGLGVTCAVLFGFVFRLILDGHDPVLVTVAGSMLILGANMPLSHGWSRRTALSFLSTAAGLLLSLLVSWLFTFWANLSGLASEESVFLFWNIGGALNPQGLLLAAFILGSVGVLDDIAIAQGEAVHEIRQANPSISNRNLFGASLRLGRHHIASTVNTLVLAYVGSAMPLLLLFMTSKVGMVDFLNTELVAEEVVRTLAGTFALVATVPIATALSVFGNSKTRLQLRNPDKE